MGLDCCTVVRVLGDGRLVENAFEGRFTYSECALWSRKNMERWFCAKFILFEMSAKL